MKLRIYFFATICFITSIGFAQIGIGTVSPDASSVLDMVSTTQGVLIPRMTTAQRTAIGTPAIGLQVYDTDTKSIWSYNGADWVNGTGGPGKFIDGATTDIAFYDGRVGIGLNNFSTAHKLWVEGVKTDDAINTASRVVAKYEGTGVSTATYAEGHTVENAGTGFIDFAAASYNQIVNEQGGSIVTSESTRSELVNKTGNTVFLAYGSSIDLNNDGTIFDAVGQYILYQGSGTVENSYAIFIHSDFNKGTNNNFAIYSASNADSYLEGSLGVGTESPQQKIHISGAMRLEPQTTAPTGTLGDLYVGTDGNLYFNDGSAVAGGWKQVQLVP